MPYKLTDFDILNAKRLYETDTSVSITSLSIQIGINRKTLAQKFKLLGVHIRQPGESMPTIQQAVHDYKNGMSELAVSKKYGITRGPIRKWLIRCKIHIRNGSEANIIRM